MTVEPAEAILAPGATVQFTVLAPPQGALTWSVSPSQGGTVDPDGLFKATGPPGVYTIAANLLTPLGRFTGSARVVITQPPSEGATRPNTALASGTSQSDLAMALDNDPQVGLTVPSGISRNGSGALTVRHGFVPTNLLPAPRKPLDKP